MKYSCLNSFSKVVVRMVQRQTTENNGRERQVSCQSGSQLHYKLSIILPTQRRPRKATEQKELSNLTCVSNIFVRRSFLVSITLLAVRLTREEVGRLEIKVCRQSLQEHDVWKKAWLVVITILQYTQRMCCMLTQWQPPDNLKSSHTLKHALGYLITNPLSLPVMY